jgi:hypothetical protein
MECYRRDPLSWDVPVTTFAVTTAELRRLPGQKFIQPQQSVPIVLKRDASGK